MAIYYVDPSGGSNGNPGSSFGLAWATTQHALDNATASDEVRLCKTATESISAKIDADTNAGGIVAPITFVSYNSTGTAQEDGYIIQASASITAVIDFAAASDYTKWVGVVFDANANATHCLYNNVDGSDTHTFSSCRFTNGTGDNINVRGNAVPGWSFFNCETDLSGGYGIDHSAGGRGTVFWRGGSIHDNASGGWNVLEGSCELHGANVYDNGGASGPGVELTSSSTGFKCSHCVFYGNGGNGITGYFATNRYVHEIHSCAFVGNGGYGYDFNVSDTDVAFFMDYNLFYGNSSDDSDQTLPGLNNVTGSDPLFTSTTDGSEDFTPQTGSPLIGAALDGGNIGGNAHADGGGGGGGLRLAGAGGLVTLVG